MALTEKSRSALYQGLSAIADEQAVQEMLSYFPARDVEEPVTKEFLRAELSDVEHSIRSYMSAMETGIRADMSAMETGIRADMSAMETGIRADMSAMELRLTERIDRAFRWNIITMITIAAVIVAAIRI